MTTRTPVVPSAPLSGPPRTPLTRPTVGMLQELVSQLARQRSEAEVIGEKLSDKIDGLDPELRDEVRDARIRALREDVAGKLLDIEREAATLRDRVPQWRALWSPAAVQRDARFVLDAPPSSDTEAVLQAHLVAAHEELRWRARLAGASLGDLEAYAEQAAALAGAGKERGLALAHLVRETVAARQLGDVDAAPVRAWLAAVPLSKAQEQAFAALDQLAAAAAGTLIRAQEVRHGQVSPESRLDAVFAASQPR